jgi:hypothetical protein
MTLLAEEIVEEWLNRNGYFTIRGIKLGVQEIDLLALAIRDTGIEARHIEVQASINPVGYLCPLPKDAQKKTGRKSTSIKLRTSSELAEGVREWVNKKYFHTSKQRIRNTLYPGEWHYELVIRKVKYPEELKLIEEYGIKIHRLDDIVFSLSNDKTIIPGAAGSDLLELVILGRD